MVKCTNEACNEDLIYFMYFLSRLNLVQEETYNVVIQMSVRRAPSAVHGFFVRSISREPYDLP